jgi:hypothetical protein
MIRFWIRTDRDGIPDMVLRQYTDDEGIWHTESRTPRRAEWETYLGVDYSGAGGSADWETATPEQWAQVQVDWGYVDNPVEGI